MYKCIKIMMTVHIWFMLRFSQYQKFCLMNGWLCCLCTVCIACWGRDWCHYHLHCVIKNNCQTRTYHLCCLNSSLWGTDQLGTNDFSVLSSAGEDPPAVSNRVPHQAEAAGGGQDVHQRLGRLPHASTLHAQPSHPVSRQPVDFWLSPNWNGKHHCRIWWSEWDADKIGTDSLYSGIKNIRDNRISLGRLSLCTGPMLLWLERAAHSP